MQAKMDGDTMRVVMDLSAPLFFLASHLDQYPRACSEVIDDVVDHIDTGRKQLIQHDVNADQIDAIIYATAAVVDEMVMRSTWTGKTEWSKQALCIRLFNDSSAGRHFFERIHELRERPITNALSLWHYWRCIQLGFEGQYQNTDGRVLRDTLATLESGLKEAGFIAGHFVEPVQQPDQLARGNHKPAWPLYRYLLLSVLLLPILIFAVHDLAISGAINQLQTFIQQQASEIQDNSRFIRP